MGDPASDISMPANYRRGRFLIDGSDGDYPGFTDGSLWNGWACPVFEREVADRVAADLSVSRGRAGLPGQTSAIYDHESDSYRVEEDGNDPVWFGSETILVDSREVAVYTLGTRYWTWEEDQESVSAGS